VVLVKPSPDKLIEIARLDALKSKTWNPPTLAGRWLLLRNDREAVCYELAGK
jgi:outer membrane protein assembly factor BamB